jgi:hypothetical protein
MVRVLTWTCCRDLAIFDIYRRSIEVPASLLKVTRARTA